MVGPPCSPRDSRESSPTPQFKSINSSALSFLHSPTLTSIHDHWKNHSLDRTDLVGKVMFLLFNMLSRLVITFLPRSKRLLAFHLICLISWFFFNHCFKGEGKSYFSSFCFCPYCYHITHLKETPKSPT